MRISIQGIEIPVEVESFITPDWKKVMDFYFEWKKQMKERGDEPWPFQPYYLEYLKELVKTGHRGRTEQEWTDRIFEHFRGLSFFEKYQTRDLES